MLKLPEGLVLAARPRGPSGMQGWLGPGTGARWVGWALGQGLAGLAGLSAVVQEGLHAAMWGALVVHFKEAQTPSLPLPLSLPPAVPLSQ